LPTIVNSPDWNLWVKGHIVATVYLVPTFKAVNGSKFAQVINVGDLWVCATNCFTTADSKVVDIFIYDSLQRKVLSQICNCTDFVTIAER